MTIAFVLTNIWLIPAALIVFVLYSVFATFNQH